MAMQQTGRSRTLPLVLSAVILFTAGCSRKPPEIYVEFAHWPGEDGSAHWRLTVPPDSWRTLGGGERLDEDHQALSARTVERVDGLLDAALKKEQLCPGAWQMGEVRRREDGTLTFEGRCENSIRVRT